MHKNVFNLLQDIIIFSLNDYKEQLNSSFVRLDKLFFEPECNRHIRANKHFIRGFCFLKILDFFEVDKKCNLGLDFLPVLFRLNFLVSRNYTDYYMVVRHFICDTHCMHLIMKMPKTKLQSMLRKAIVSDKITGLGIFKDTVFNQITSIHFDASQSSEDPQKPADKKDHQSRLKR